MGILGIPVEILGAIVVVLFVGIYYFMIADRPARSRSFRSRHQTEPTNIFGNNPFIPDWMEESPGKAVAIIVIVLFILLTALNCVHIVEPGYRGVLITMGTVTERNFDEGMQFKTPYFSRMVDMKVTLEKEEVTESAASSDLQEVMTTLTVHFNVNPNSAWQMYRNMRKNYHSLLLKPIIQEDLKATTAQFSAEELIKSRSLLVMKLKDKLSHSLEPYGIEIQTVNFVDFQFTEGFMNAIEAKVTAEQAALEAQNYLEQVKYEAQQKVINANAEKNATIIRAEGAARQKVIAAEASALQIVLEANATSQAMRLITSQMTPEYQRYLYLQSWDGELPDTLVGPLEELGLIIDLDD